MAVRLEHRGFDSREYKREGKKRTMRYFKRESGPRTRRKYDGGGSMLVKMSLCALLCALVLLSNRFAKSGVLIETASNLTEKAEELGHEYLGKLRFVELPGMIQVFSSGSRLRLGVNYTSCELAGDGVVLMLCGAAGNTVPAPADGTVKAIQTEANGSTTIDLAISGDIVISYGNACDAAVEDGQPVKAGDTLFSAAEPLLIRVYSAGRPVCPTDYFDMDAAKTA